MGEQIKFLVLDYETRSEADLKKTGSFNYARHPSTQILCAAWRLGTRENLRKARTEVWSPALSKEPPNFIEALKDPKVMVVAHNALFEQVVTRFTLGRRHDLPIIPPSRWVCTAALAAGLALPRNLEGACAALSLPAQKDMEGRRLLLKMCKPRKPTKNNPSKWHATRADLERLMLYCARDIDAETELFLTVPALTPTERRVWKLDQKINLRGFQVDTDLVDAALEMKSAEDEFLLAETNRLTGGEVNSTAQVAATLDWLARQGVHILDLKKDTVEHAVAELGEDDLGAKRLLEIRQSASKSSVKKYPALLARTAEDGRMRDNLLFYAASTGRWGGVGFQPQNLPRPSIKDTDTAASVVKMRDAEFARSLYGDVMQLLSNTLRSVIVAAPGNRLVWGDYNAIEARGLFWLANDEPGLEVFRRGEDPYCAQAADIYARPIDKEKDPLERQLGKTAILGLGYGMGAPKFHATCLAQKQTVSVSLAERAVKSYRRLHAPVPKLWGNLERAAIYAVRNPGTRVRINHTEWSVSNGFLWCKLPSGRSLANARPSVSKIKKFGEPRDTLVHWAVDNKTRQWKPTPTWGGILTENVCQAVCRDLMAEAMLRVEEAGYKVILSVHDELITEAADGFGSAAEFTRIMAEVPAWAKGFPITVESKEGLRYRK